MIIMGNRRNEQCLRGGSTGARKCSGRKKERQTGDEGEGKIKDGNWAGGKLKHVQYTRNEKCWGPRKKISAQIFLKSKMSSKEQMGGDGKGSLLGGKSI